MHGPSGIQCRHGVTGAFDGCLACFNFLGHRPSPWEPDFRVLAVNDVYKPERFALVRSLARGLSKPSKLVMPGDLLGGSLFASEHRGQSVIELLNATQVDYCLLGNHEFDYGEDRLRELMDMSNFTWLGSNVRESEGIGTERPMFHTTMDVDVFHVPLLDGASVKVGVFGLCTAATPRLSHPSEKIVFEDPIRHAERCVKLLQEQLCEVLLALTHLNLHQDKQVAHACPALHAILGGHDHDPYFLVHHGVLIAKCGQNADHVGVLDFHFKRSENGALRIEHSYQFRSTKFELGDTMVSRVFTKWEIDGDEDVLCTIGTPLSTRTQELRSRENAFGCMVADAMLSACCSDGCDGALINGGFIRQDRLYPANSGLTAQQVKEEMPFPKHPAVIRLSGAELLRGLEESVAMVPTPAGCFPHLSEGMAMKFDPSAPPLKRIHSLTVAGREVETSREYLIAINSIFNEIAADGIDTFHRAPCARLHGELIRDVFANKAACEW